MRRQFLIVFVPLLLFFTLGFYYYNNSEIEMNKNELILELASDLNHVDNIITNEFEAVSSDLHYLSTQNELINVLDDGIAPDDLALEYLAFSNSKELYDQVRYLDSTGMEMVRVNYDNGAPIIVPESNLQNKSKRYYFEDAYKLSRSEVFVSPFDLNIEGGEIEKPLKPMIRFGTPVYDSNGEKRGIVLLNYLGNNLFETIETQVDDIGNTVLLNSDGYWIMGEAPEREWGFMYPEAEDKTFINEFPDEWARIQEIDEGYFIESGYLYSFSTVYPLLESQISSSGSSGAFTPSISEIEYSEYNWKIVSYVAVPEFNSMLGVNITLIYGFYLGGIIVIVSFSWLYSQSLEQRRKLREEREAKMEALHSSATLLNREQSPEDLFISTIKIIEDVVGTHWVDMAEPREEAMVVTLSSKKTENQIIIQYDQPSIILRAYNERKAILVKDITKDPDYIFLSNEEVAHRSEIVVPVFVGDEIRALINVESEVPTELNESDKKLIEIIALHVSSSLERIERNAEMSSLNNELERSNKELESYTYVVSHDLKAPLRSIRTFSEFLLEDNAEQLDDDGKMYLTRMTNAAAHMDTLISDLLMMSRVGRMYLETEQVDLNEVLDGIKNDLYATIEERGATVNVSKLPTIEGQKTWIKQLFTNFISNGLKFNESGNPLIEINVEETPEEYTFRVTDNGIGIAPENHDKIFKLFERLHTNEEYEGTGAGLTICMKIVNDWGGRLWVESEAGKGSSFHFTLPKK
jgi:signal transduction histidine kinase